MPLTVEQEISAAAARRMLADDHFLAFFDRITKDAAEKSVFLEEPTQREANRQLVLAISRIMGELKADAELPEAVKASDEHARAME